MTIDIPVKLDQNIDVPKYETAGAAGVDLRAREATCIRGGETQLVKTGISAAIPEGYVGFVCSRSGLALKNSVFVLNAPGVVDSDYRGEWGVIIHNAGEEDFYINLGDRIAQMVIMKVEQAKYIAVNDLDETTRGTGGFGSTGTK